MRSVEELEEILGDTSWEFFEQRHTGDLFVRVDKGLLGFYMRVGNYMKQPLQVIMADGIFIRTRDAQKWTDCVLKELDVNNPNSCTYPNSGYDNDRPIWKPGPPQATAGPYVSVASTVPLGSLQTITTGGTYPLTTTTIGGTYPLGQQNVVPLYTQGTSNPNWLSKMFGFTP